MEPKGDLPAQKLKIAQITAVFPPYWSGTGNVAYYTALELARRGHETHIFTAQMFTDGYQDPAELNVHRLWTPFRIGNAPLTPGLITALRDFHLLHLHWPFIFGAELTWIATHLSKIPYVMTYHLDLRADRRRVFGVYQRIWGPLLVRGAQKVIAVSMEHLKASEVYPFLVERPEAIAEVPNGVDITKFHPEVSPKTVRYLYNIPAGAFVIIFVGAMDRAHEYKGVPDLLKAFALLDDSKTWLLLVGGGSLLPKYRALISQLPVKLQKRIILTGSVPHEHLPVHYAAADIGVLPSRQPESFGMVLVEAMACGKPVVASDFPGVRSVVSHGKNGLLFRSGDIAGLASSISLLIEDLSLRHVMGNEALQTVRAKFAWPRVIDHLVRVYREVMLSSEYAKRSLVARNS